MLPAIPYNPGLTLALALVIGMTAQSIARHIRVPGIVLLLATGVFLGPDGLGLIQPASLGSGLNILTGFAVAVILFEGGMSLRFKRLKKVHKAIRHLILYGGAITVAGGTLAARYFLSWPIKTSLLFGTLVMVTGPTVINPILKRLRVTRSVATILEAEGVFIDAIGAVVAIVALEAATGPHMAGPYVWLWHVFSRIGFGIISGGAAGMILVRLLKSGRAIAEGMENVFILCAVLALFQAANSVLAESGIAAVTVAGLFVGNLDTGTTAIDDLAEFKEGLTVMLIGMLFVLLAADVRINQVTQLGLPGLLVVVALIAVVRPLAVFAGCARSTLSWREKVFIASIGPRGIVAAAVASLFAANLAENGIPGGYALRAMVFLVILATVFFSGIVGPVIAGILGLRRPLKSGWVILGANDLARGLAKVLKTRGEEVISIDANADHCRAARDDCTKVIFGNGLEARTLQRAEIDTRRGAIAATENEEVNLLFISRARAEARGISLFSTLRQSGNSLNDLMLHEAGSQVLFGNPTDVALWSVRLSRGQVVLRVRTLENARHLEKDAATAWPEEANNAMICAAVLRGKNLFPVGDQTRFKTGDKAFFFVLEKEAKFVEKALSETGWVAAGPNEPEKQDKQDNGDFFHTSMCEIE
ncbi:MAG: sodium:proton exchanger [Deltaproteobacteria bacterium]|nr:sodium:proton exchanger [Deltaproteobacteria bacterium]